MPIYIITQHGSRQVLQAVEGAEILRYVIDATPSRAPDSDVWVAAGEGIQKPTEATITADRTNLPTNIKTMADTLASTWWIGIALDDGSPLMERRVLAMTRFSLPDAGDRWGRMRATLILDAPVYQARYLVDHTSDTLTDGSNDPLYVIEEV